MSKKGLPKDFKLRHDLHYVEQLAGTAGAPIGRMIPIEKLTPNPQQPRSEIGDISDLISSIREKGVLEPLLVRPSDVGGRFMIISGERRYRASVEAELKEVPCIELDVDDRAVAEISLIENLQRKDLSAFEEADGLHSLVERFAYTHEEIAKQIGKSRTSITESLSLAGMPSDIRDRCRHADITAKSMLLQVLRQPSIDEMHGFIDKIGATGMTRDEARKIRKNRSTKREPYVFRFNGPGQSYSLMIKFRKAQVAPEEIETALTEAIRVFRSHHSD